jgi:hypothetical protein
MYALLICGLNSALRSRFRRFRPMSSELVSSRYRTGRVGGAALREGKFAAYRQLFCQRRVRYRNPERRPSTHDTHGVWQTHKRTSAQVESLLATPNIADIPYFTLNTGAKIPSVGIGCVLERVRDEFKIMNTEDTRRCWMGSPGGAARVRDM